MTKRTSGSRAHAAATVLLLLLFGCCSASCGQRKLSSSVVMLSDLHFDPFQDPSRLEELRSADTKAWSTILDRANPAGQESAFIALQQACKARGVDSSWALVKSSLHEASAQQPAPLFVLVSGDLLTHNFDCRMRTLLPSTTPEELSLFAEKTIEFIALQLRQTFRNVPIYVALGNNDSGCADKRQSLGGKFLQVTSQILSDGTSNQLHHNSIRPVFDRFDDYSAVLPGTIRHGWLIVLEDVFAMPDFKSCDGKADDTAAVEQVAWLRNQLRLARARHEQVWVMAHVPPGVDEFASFHKLLATPEKICAQNPITMMLTSDSVASTLAEFSDVVRLAVFGHTHMDEMKVLNDGAGHTVAAKILPSISPVNGNLPAFTTAKIDAQSAILKDYTVHVASDAAATSWKESYTYSATYKEPDYSSKSVTDLTQRLVADRSGESEISRSYQLFFAAGNVADHSAEVRALWPTYSCGAIATTENAFRTCMCPAPAADPR